MTEPDWFERIAAEPAQAEPLEAAAVEGESLEGESVEGEPVEGEAAVAEAVGAATPGATGHAAVDTAIGALGEAASLAPKEQVAAYAEAHQALHETLQTIEEH